MKPFKQFLMEARYEYLFHGTSSIFVASIKEHGLIPSDDSHKNSKETGVYLTTDYGLAMREAGFTTDGENGEEGVGGYPVVIVINRSLVTGLRADKEYHAYDGLRAKTSFWTPDAIPAEAIVDIAKRGNTKYRDANLSQVTKQVGLRDRQGNPIADLSGGLPMLSTGGTIRVFNGSDSEVKFGEQYWTTYVNSDRLDGYKYKWLLVVRPDEVEVVDQMRKEVIVEIPKKVDVWKRAKILPKSYGLSESAHSFMAGLSGQPINIDGVTLEIAEREGRIRLKNIESHRRGQGNASKAMQRLVDLADEHEVEVELTASPHGDEKTRLDHDQLRNFYAKFGFVPEPGYDEAYGYMIRYPKKSQPNR